MQHLDFSWRVIRRAGWLFLALSCWPLATLAADSAGVILTLVGQVEIVHDTQKRLATNRSELFSGDTIETRDGQVQVRFADGTLLTLYRDTRFAVDDYRYVKGQESRAQFSLLKGLMHTLTGLMDKQNYQLKTRLATLGVRGTEYSVQLDQALHVSVDQGLVVVTNDGGSAQVSAGQSLTVTGPNMMSKPSISGKIDLGAHGGAGRPGGPGPGSGPGSGPGGAGPGPGSAPPPPPPGTQNLSRPSQNSTGGGTAGPQSSTGGPSATVPPSTTVPSAPPKPPKPLP